MSTASSRLILVRHAAPVIMPEEAAKDWELSLSGIESAAGLADQIDAERLGEIVSSSEPKAVMARSLGMPWRTAEGLHEHERGELPWMEQDVWRAQLRDFFARPSEQVFGLETASQAGQRFRLAVRSVLDASIAGDIVIVSHGTVMALLLAEITGANAFEIWDGLQMPDLRTVPRAVFRTM